MSHYLVSVLVPHDERDDSTAARAALAPYYMYDSVGDFRPFEDVLYDYSKPTTVDGQHRADHAGRWLADNPEFDSWAAVVEGAGMWKYGREGDQDDHPDGYVANALRDAVNNGRADWRIVFMDCHD